MRIVSLLPSATEIVYSLGLGDQLEAVTFECDYPPDARRKPVVSHSALALGEGAGAGDIDAAVSASVAEGRSIYRLNAGRISAIDPDVILTQDLCRVCAVPTGDVEAALDTLGCRADVVSLDPPDLAGVVASIGAVGAAAGVAARAAEVIATLNARLDAVRASVAGRRRVRTLALEWVDPPFTGGHWVPDMIEAAGGESLLAEAGAPSRRLDWDEVATAGAEVVLVVPCGFDLDRAAAEGGGVLGHPALDGVRQVWAAHGDAYFSRPGPRVVDGVEALAWMLHPDAMPEPAPGRVRALR